MSAGKTGLPLGEAHRLAISQAMTGRQLSEAHKQAIAQGHKIHEHTPSDKDHAAYMRAWREAQKEKQQAKEAQGQTSIDKAFKKAKK
jgi:hypothetical protein